MSTIHELSQRAHTTAVAHGFHEREIAYQGDAQHARHILSLLMLITTEVAEAAEAVRKNLPVDDFASELADVCIRTFDCAEALGIDLESAIEAKMKLNESRPYKHGGKRV